MRHRQIYCMSCPVFNVRGKARHHLVINIRVKFSNFTNIAINLLQNHNHEVSLDSTATIERTCINNPNMKNNSILIYTSTFQVMLI